MGLNSIATAGSLEQALVAEYSSAIKGTDSVLLVTLNTILDAGFQQAIPTQLNVDITTPAGTLNIPYGSSYDMAKNIGVECARYWSDTIATTGAPQSCAGIDSISNTAGSIATIIETGLLALGTGVRRDPPYVDFVDVIYNAVKTIVWTVNESDALLCSATLTVTVT